MIITISCNDTIQQIFCYLAERNKYKQDEGKKLENNKSGAN